MKGNYRQASLALRKFRRTVTLRDGSSLVLRAIQPEDAEKLIAFVRQLSPHTAYLRFHHVQTHLSEEEAKYLCSVDYANSFALLATAETGKEERIVAVGRYFRLPDRDTAEVAFVVDDVFQRKGLGSQLLKQLAQIARRNGIHFLQAEVLGENEEMMRVFQESGFRMTQELKYGVYGLILDIRPDT